jgi:hypothetical protein
MDMGRLRSFIGVEIKPEPLNSQHCWHGSRSNTGDIRDDFPTHDASLGVCPASVNSTRQARQAGPLTKQRKRPRLRVDRTFRPVILRLLASGCRTIRGGARTVFGVKVRF